MSDTANNSESEFSKLLEEWKNSHETSGYDPVPFLASCAKIFEAELMEFHKGDPDPFDERHPEYTQPGCTFGKLLVTLSKAYDLMEKLTSTYIRTQSDSKNVTPVTIATARFLLAASPGLEFQTVCKEKEWLTKLLLEWTASAAEPLRTYATGLLVGAIEPQRTSNEEYIKLISILLKRLWNYVRPGKFSDISNLESSQQNVRGDNDSETTVPLTPRSQKRKYSSDIDTPTMKKVMRDAPQSSNHKLLKHNGTSDNDLSFTGDFYDNDLSNSSWSEQMPAMLGSNYSLETPLSSTVCQRFILDFLKCLGEYQDLLSIFLELKSLDLINIYLKEKKSDGLLTFKALEFLSSLLCHNKVATEFIELNGIQNLLVTQRPSMGSTGVSLCLYYLAYRKDAMERVCQLPGRVLAEMVKYAIWLLECSHETGRSHAALFFSISFSFRVILNLFDRMNGLRCLVNMISTSKPIVNSLDENYDPDEDTNRHFIRQTTRTVCAALKKYFEAHLQIKVHAAQKILPKSKEHYLPVEAVSKYKPMVCSREHFLEYLEILGDLPEDGPNGLKCLSNWPPVHTFHRLDGVQLMLKVIDIAFDWSSFAGQIEVIRSALDALAVVTLCRVPQMLLTKQHSLDKKLTGISILLSIAKGGLHFTTEGETQKSALAVIMNCVSGHANNNSEQDVATKSVHGTPKHKKQKKGKETLWKHVQYSNGIHVLLTLLVTTQPAHHADELRYLACKALRGLSNYKPVAQIMSKLPFFVSGQIQSIAKEPVLNDKKRIHAKFCKCMEALLEKVSGKPTSLDLDFDAIRKSHIVSETHMQYDNKDLLLMVHNHLVWSKLQNAADALAREAGLFSESLNESVIATPRSRNGAISRLSIERRGGGSNGSGDATTTRLSRRISFARGHHASGETPTPSPVINIMTPTSQRKISLLQDGRASAYANSNGQQRFQLSCNSVVSVKPKSAMSQGPLSPPTLNSIVEENFKHQHAKCRNPVVTVPEFSLFTPHRCPEPRYTVEASANFTTRSYHRQGIRPRWGGVGGVGCDLQLVYSRYKPGYTIKGAEDRKIPFCTVAFMPGDEQVILGDTQGDVVIHNLYSDEDQVIQGVASSPIMALEPSRNGESILVQSESYWTNSCSLHAMGDQLEHKFSYDDTDFVEFSKLVQDKVIGTKAHKAVVFDASTGQTLDTFEREDMSCYYKDNRATFSPDDKLILSDGLLWDVRKSHSTPIHKFDQFNENVSGVFHPSGLEVIINTEVWDLRNYHLLHTVPSLDQCCLCFNCNGTAIYAVRRMSTNPEKEESSADKALLSAFRTFDATDYKQLGFIAVRHQIYDLALDKIDYNVAVIETVSNDDSWRDPAMSVCRFYEVGMSRGDEDEDEESNFDQRSTDGSSSSGDDDDDDDDADDDDAIDLGDLTDIGSTGSSMVSDDDGGDVFSDEWETESDDVESVD